jgi:glutathione synthase/RimK-type ligase-like ATP-grasp enzyme
MAAEHQIFLATNKRDITTDFIVLELRKRKIPFLRLNTEDLPKASVTFTPAASDDWHLFVSGCDHLLSQFTAGYYRRPGDPFPTESVSNQTAREHCISEWFAVLRSVWNALEGRWLNSPFAILRAEDKPRQLALAKGLGFMVPETMITNDPQEAVRFATDNRLVGKPLRQALLEQGETGEVIFTSRLKQSDFDDPEAILLAPFILQREVPKQCDVRVTVVGERIFAASIWSQAFEETSIDWRRGSNPKLRHEVIALPRNLEIRCVELAKRLDLSFGAIDLILDTAGDFWFLEINPNGQWAWIERRTGLPIAAAIVDKLLEIGR